MSENRRGHMGGHMGHGRGMHGGEKAKDFKDPWKESFVIWDGINSDFF